MRDLSKITIAIDFDGTCVTHEFPEVGRDIGAVPVLKRLVAAGAKLILWTMRSDNVQSSEARNGKPLSNKHPLTDAINWFKAHDIPLYGVQSNPTQKRWTSSPKAYAHLYIDDAALGCPLKVDLDDERPFVDWAAVEAMLFPVAPPRLIRTWAELAELEPTSTHRIQIDEQGFGWIWPLEASSDGNCAIYYLTTHTFYAQRYAAVTAKLQACGWYVQLANWDANKAG